MDRTDAAASVAPPSEAKGGLCRGSIVGAVESAIFRVQTDQHPGHSKTRSGTNRAIAAPLRGAQNFGKAVATLI